MRWRQCGAVGAAAPTFVQLRIKKARSGERALESLMRSVCSVLDLVVHAATMPAAATVAAAHQLARADDFSREIGDHATRSWSERVLRPGNLEAAFCEAQCG